MTAHPHHNQQFYLTTPAPCPYLDGRFERKVFTHLTGERAPALHDELTRNGFRRSQNIAYRPACEGCRACTATRVIVDRFKPTRSMRRTLKRNADLVGEEVAAIPTSEQYSLFRRYIESRHGDGGMVAMSVLDYATMVEESHVDTRMLIYRKRGPDTAITGRGEGPLIAVVLFDRLRNGFSMVYSFFDPQEDRRSLGTFVILDHIARTRRAGLPHCHLGYYVAASPKMAYKARFQPQQRLTLSGWVDVVGEEPSSEGPRTELLDGFAHGPSAGDDAPDKRKRRPRLLTEELP